MAFLETDEMTAPLSPLTRGGPRGLACKEPRCETAPTPGSNASTSKTQKNLLLRLVGGFSGEGFGEGPGEWDERVTTQVGAMIRPKTVALSRIGWTPTTGGIHTARRDRSTLSHECQQPCQEPSKWLDSPRNSQAVSREIDRDRICADFSLDEVADRPHDTLMKGWPVIPMGIRTCDGTCGTAGGPGG